MRLHGVQIYRLYISKCERVDRRGIGAGDGRGGAAGYEAPALGNLNGSRGEGEGEETL